MAPRLAAAERMPKSRFDCPVSTMSTISIQKTETTKRLKTDVQMKNARPTQTWATPSVAASRKPNTRRLRMKNR